MIIFRRIRRRQGFTFFLKKSIFRKKEKEDKARNLHSNVESLEIFRNAKPFFKTIRKSTLLAVQLVQEHNGQNKPKMIHTKT